MARTAVRSARARPVSASQESILGASSPPAGQRCCALAYDASKYIKLSLPCAKALLAFTPRTPKQAFRACRCFSDGLEHERRQPRARAPCGHCTVS